MGSPATVKYWQRVRGHHHDLVETAYNGSLILGKGWEGGDPHETWPDASESVTVAEWRGTRVGGFVTGALVTSEINPPEQGASMVRTVYRYAASPIGRGLLAVYTSLDTVAPDSNQYTPMESTVEADLDMFFRRVNEIQVVGLRPSENSYQTFLAEMQRGASAPR